MTTRRTGRGFTLIELMISLAIGSLLVIMLLTIFGRLSYAYREQQNIVTTQQTLTAARAAIELDAKQAGFGMAQGFKLKDGLLHSPIRVVNSSSGPDELGFYYGDPGSPGTGAAAAGRTQALATSAGPATTVTFDDPSGFAAADVVVLSTADLATFTNPVNPTTDAKIAKYDACVVQISSISGTTVVFSQAGSWGQGGNAHCSNTAAGTTMMYRFVAHAWRLDPTTTGSPTRTSLGVLQRSPTGNLIGAADFMDMAYAFTDLQVATYFYDKDYDATDTADPDSDGARDWYSSTMQDTWTQPIAMNAAFYPPLAVSISLVARTERDVEGVYTSATPTLTVAANPANNLVGDRASVAVPSATDDRLKGKRIYRYLTFRVDMRNLGVGR